ncbi:MAG TPA: M20/M25/M40 family metallo-hydrolase [Dehalococcoidia bacterium]|nr:M20/M25/M40 family metallo-hydrolase [Dehalococcoidia bacterium]
MQALNLGAPGKDCGTAIARVASLTAVTNAFAWLDRHPAACERETAAIAEIPAPTFGEERRAAYVAQRLQELGAEQVHGFGLGNVAGRFGPTTGEGIALLAHLDTVFTEAVDHRVSRRGGRLYGPGVGDNSAGVAGTITALAAAQAAGLRFERPVWVVGNVGEEGLGDLRGSRDTMEHFAGRLSAVLAIEGTMLGRLGHVAVGSRRLKVRFHAEGGHSWLDFGKASAVHAAVQAAAEIARLKVPTEPRTTFNIGRISGGDGVNVVAPSAELLLDMRSVGVAALADLSDRVEEILRRAAGPEITVEIEEVGQRPAGSIPRTHPLMQLCAAVLLRVGVRPEPTAGSTDANIPLSQGIPALALGVTRGAGIHSASEWIEIAPMRQGVQQLVLVCAALAGVAE